MKPVPIVQFVYQMHIVPCVLKMLILFLFNVLAYTRNLCKNVNSI